MNQLDLSSHQIKLYRMSMPEHECPWGLKAVKILQERGVDFEDIKLRSREEIDGFGLICREFSEVRFSHQEIQTLWQKIPHSLSTKSRSSQVSIEGDRSAVAIFELAITTCLDLSKRIISIRSCWAW